MAEKEIYSHQQEVKIGSMLENAAQYAAEKADTDDNAGKGTAGVSLNALFSPFEIAAEESEFGFSNFPTYDELYALVEAGTLASGDFDKIVHLNKFLKKKYKVISDKNLQDNSSERTMGQIYDVPVGEENSDSQRPICLNAPLWLNGYGFDEQGNEFGDDRVGALDLQYNTKSRMWETNDNKILGKNTTGETIKTGYVVESNGANEDNEKIIDVKKPTADNLTTVLFALEDIPADSIGKFTTMCDDRRALVYVEKSEEDEEEDIEIGSYVGTQESSYRLLFNNSGFEIVSFTEIVDGDDTYYKCYVKMVDDKGMILAENVSGENISGGSFAEITGIDSETGVVEINKPSEDSIAAAQLVVIPANESLPTEKRGWVFPATLPHINVNYNSAAPSVGDDFGCVANQWYGEKDKTGFKALGAFGGSARVSPFKYVSNSVEAIGSAYTTFGISSIFSLPISAGSRRYTQWKNISPNVIIRDGYSYLYMGGTLDLNVWSTSDGPASLWCYCDIKFIDDIEIYDVFEIISYATTYDANQRASTGTGFFRKSIDISSYAGKTISAIRISCLAHPALNDVDDMSMNGDLLFLDTVKPI